MIMRRTRALCSECPVLNKGLCGALCEHEVAKLSSSAWHRQYSAGQVIHAEGEKPASFCAVMTGVVKLSKSLPNGTQQIVGLLLAGDFLGRPFGAQSHASAVAATNVRLCWFPRAAVERLASESRDVERWLFNNVSDELEKAQDWIVLLGRMTAEQRVASFILHVASRNEVQNGEDGDGAKEVLLELPLSRTEMADYLGLTLETVSRQIARLRQRGVIAVGASRSVIVRKPDALLAIVESALAPEASNSVGGAKR